MRPLVLVILAFGAVVGSRLVGLEDAVSMALRGEITNASCVVGLLATGSADFHGPQHEKFSRFGAFELYGLEPVLGPIGR